MLISAVQESDSVIYIIFHILFHYGLSQDIEYSSLCSTVGPCSSLLFKVNLPQFDFILYLTNEQIQMYFF